VTGLSPQAQSVLAERAAAGGPAMREAPVSVSRAGQWEWLPYMGARPTVQRVDHRFIASPTAEIPVRVYWPEGEGPFPALVAFHGGCWMVGNIGLADRPHRLLADRTGCIVVAVNYQKAPEHPFPVPLDDCYAGYRWTIEHAAELGVDSSRIGVVGDSAGGNLAAAVCLRSRDSNEQQPAAQVLIYPALDPGLATSSAEEFAEGYGLTTADMRWTWEQYAVTADALLNPWVAPSEATSLENLPPAVVVTAGFDVLRDEGLAYIERLAAAGVTTVPLHYPDTIHGFLWMAGRVDVTTQMLDDVSLALRTLWT
jgi:acetyl esterase